MQRTGWTSYSRRSRMWYVAPWANKFFCSRFTATHSMQALVTPFSHFYHKIATPSYVSTPSTIPHMQSNLSRCFSTVAILSPSRQPFDPAKCSVHITTMWSDHGCCLGFVVRITTSRPRSAFRRHFCSRICPQRIASFRMAPRHLQRRTGMLHPRHHMCL